MQIKKKHMSIKRTIQILAVSATALITACEEQVTSNDFATPITVTSQISEKTRAGYESSNYQNLPTEFIMDITQDTVLGSENYDYSLVTMKRDESSNAYSADGTLLLWKGSNHSRAGIKAMTIPYGLTAIDPDNAMITKVHTNQATDENVKLSDLLGAKTGDGVTIDEDNINIEFSHLMTKLYVNYKFSTDLTDKNAKVNSITLKNICVQGGYSYKEMDYVNSSLAYGNIQMYHNSADKAAEAIFYPYTPTSNPQLEVSININGENKTLTRPVELKDNKSFDGRKKYIMNIRINGNTIDNTSITVVKDWTEDNESIEAESNIKILWIGTSIPADAYPNNNNYPYMIAEATGYTIINHAVPGSFLNFNKDDKIGWQTPENVVSFEYYVKTHCLAATPTEMYDRWYNELKQIQVNGNQSEETLNEWMNYIYSQSYVNRIIPYINGEISKCNVVIIDHGFNDAGALIAEGLGYKYEKAPPYGLQWLESLKNGTTKYADNYNLGLKSYFVCMDRIINEINACKSVNPDLKIIIGNYFAQSVPVFDEYYPDHGGAECAKLIIKANEAVANIYGLDIVNVYEYTGLDDRSSHDLFNKFCPDKFHPSSDPQGRLNKIIAQTYIQELKKILGK